MSAPVQVAVTGPFDEQGSRTLRFLQEAARLGEVTVLLWPDDTVRALDWKPLKFPLAERAYFLQALRYVKQVVPVKGEVAANALPGVPGFTPDLWVVEEAQARRNGPFASSTGWPIGSWAASSCADFRQRPKRRPRQARRARKSS